MCDCASCKAGGPTYTEEHKQACLERYWQAKAREIMDMPSLSQRREALAKYRKIKPAIAERLEAIIKAEWGKRR